MPAQSTARAASRRSFQESRRFNMVCLRKHIEQVNFPESIPFTAELGEVSRQRGRITGHADDASWRDCGQFFSDAVIEARAGRIHHNDVWCACSLLSLPLI